MQFQGRAFYNLLTLSYQEDPSIAVEPWQVQNYRELSTSHIFQLLEKLNIPLNQENFLLYTETCDTPEELIECLWVQEAESQEKEKAYLLLFELWRRFVPEKLSLSVFCDELDRCIALYDEEGLEKEDSLQTLLTDLEGILDQGVDYGGDPKEIFQNIQRYSAHDLEGFFYDYISEQLETGQELYASELIDGFCEYVSEPKWFDFLRAWLFSLADTKESDILICRILEQTEEDPDLQFLLEICRFLVHRGDAGLFFICVKQIVPLLKLEEDLIQLLELIAEFYRCLDKETLEKTVQALLTERKKKSQKDFLQESDAKAIENLLSDLTL